MPVIEWLNTNDGAVMAILTLVYVIATILICVFNYKSASTARKQTEEAQRQFEESNRAHVIPRFVTLEGQLYCLAFHNIGKTMAEKLNIKLSEEWLCCLKRTQKNSGVADTLSNLADIETFLPAEDKYLYSICIPADGTGDYSLLCEKPLIIDISYQSGNKTYSEKFALPMKGINSIINTSDYVRMEKKKRDSLEAIEKQLKNMNKSIANCRDEMTITEQSKQGGNTL